MTGFIGCDLRVTSSEHLVSRYVADALSALGTELRGVRRARGLSQGELANRMATSVSQQAIAGYETGTIVMSVTRLIELCFALNLSPLVLLSRVLKPVRTVLDLRALGSISRPELAALRQWARLNDDTVVVYDAGVRAALSTLSGLDSTELDAALASALTKRPVGSVRRSDSGAGAMAFE